MTDKWKTWKISKTSQYSWCVQYWKSLMVTDWKPSILNVWLINEKHGKYLKPHSTVGVYSTERVWWSQIENLAFLMYGW